MARGSWGGAQGSGGVCAVLSYLYFVGIGLEEGKTLELELNTLRLRSRKTLPSTRGCDRSQKLRRSGER